MGLFAGSAVEAGGSRLLLLWKLRPRGLCWGRCSIIAESGATKDYPVLLLFSGVGGGGGRVEWGQQMLDRRMLVLVVLQQGWPNG